MMKAVFFDACPTMLAKNGLPIAEIFKTKEPDLYPPMLPVKRTRKWNGVPKTK